MRSKTNAGTEFPKARTSHILTEEVAGELLVFDSAGNRAHCLNGSAAAIWRHSDGRRSVTQLAEHLFPALSASEGEQMVRLGLERLRRRKLLEGAPQEMAVDLSKRHLIRKMAIVAAAAGLAAPLVSSVVAPHPSYAFSCLPRGMPCSSGVNCCSGSCVVLMCQ